MYTSPIRSTPLEGPGANGNWRFHSALSPCNMDVRKKLFDTAMEEESGQKQWSPSSEYFSQSVNECSGLSEGSQTNLFGDASSEGMGQGQVTPHTSPFKHPAGASSNFSSPPILKKQRLFSPSSPTTPDKFPACFRSPMRPTLSPEFSLDSSCDSLTALNEMMGPGEMSRDGMVCSPPRLERLQLFDYPRTPLSIARSSGLDVKPELEHQPPENYENTRPTRSQSRLFTRGNRVKRRINQYGTHLVRRNSRGTNINPFSPSEVQGRARIVDPASKGPASSPLVNSVGSKPHKKLALRESNISRYKEEFHEVCEIGSGSFGTVYKCINRLDGCVYALKRSHKPVAGSSDEPAALREVCAHAVLGSHPHLVRYYSAWAEDDHMLIQNEFCDGGNLSSRIIDNRRKGQVFGEGELKRLLRHVSLGLQYIHSMGLVHLDIKPDNIFISSVRDAPGSYITDPQEEPTAMEEEGETAQFIYKIGDMGLVTSLKDPRVEEGDCRYMPRELLQDNYAHLTKADVYSLGLTVFHAGDGRELPKNGEEWHRLRDGLLPCLPLCSSPFNKLLQVMVHKDPAQRPSPSELLSLSIICPSTQKSKAQLRKELNEEKFKNEILLRELKQAREQTLSEANEKNGLCGPRLNRSMSIA